MKKTKKRSSTQKKTTNDPDGASAGVLPHNYIEILTKSKAEKKKGQGGSFWGDDKPEEAEVEVVAVAAPAEQKQEEPGEQQQEQQQQGGVRGATARMMLLSPR